MDRLLVDSGALAVSPSLISPLVRGFFKIALILLPVLISKLETIGLILIEKGR